MRQLAHRAQRWLRRHVEHRGRGLRLQLLAVTDRSFHQLAQRELVQTFAVAWARAELFAIPETSDALPRVDAQLLALRILAFLIGDLDGFIDQCMSAILARAIKLFTERS